MTLEFDQTMAEFQLSVNLSQSLEISLVSIDDNSVTIGEYVQEKPKQERRNLVGRRRTICSDDDCKARNKLFTWRLLSQEPRFVNI